MAQVSQDWRNGDVLLAFQQGSVTAAYDSPVYTSPKHVRYAALWSFDFRTECILVMVIWRPGREPVRTEMPAGQQWSAAHQAFLGRFRIKYPGRWVPVPWAYF